MDPASRARRGGSDDEEQDYAAREVTEVLFIGDSFTARNDLPGLIGQLAAGAGHVLDHKLLSIGGASLRTHLNKGEALKEIQSGGYNVVVLQEQSTLPV